MIHVVCFSGGKDSTALVLWAREHLPEFTTVFCDTGWEHAITYAYIEEIDRRLLGGSLLRLNNPKYPSGMRDLVQIKGRAPSAKARFCTEALKVTPMIAWLKTLDDESTVYQGIRADESKSRAAMLPRQWSDDFDAWVERPPAALERGGLFCADETPQCGTQPALSVGCGAGWMLPMCNGQYARTESVAGW